MTYNEQRILKAFAVQGYDPTELEVYYGSVGGLKAWWCENVWNTRGCIWGTYLGPNIARTLHNIRVGRTIPPTKRKRAA